MTKASKVLNVSNINKQAKVLTEQVESTIFSSTTDSSFTIKVDKKLNKTKIMAMVSEIMAQLQYARTHKIQVEEVFLPYSILMMIKYFTSLGKDIPGTLNAQLEIMRKLIDLDLLQPILELFPEDETQEVFNAVSETIADTDKRVRELSGRVEEIERAYDEGRIEDTLEIEEDDWIVEEIVDATDKDNS